MKPEIFYSRTFKDQNSGCWLWEGCVSKSGYGCINHLGKSMLSHRYSYEIAYGPFNYALCVCHKCDTPLCVNPSHLFLGTKKDNADDRDRKGRNIVRVGEGHGSSKLTLAAVKEIKDAIVPRGKRAAFLKEKGISPATYHVIRRGKSWVEALAEANTTY